MVIAFLILFAMAPGVGEPPIVIGGFDNMADCKIFEKKLTHDHAEALAAPASIAKGLRFACVRFEPDA